jgi:hypothetical protein
MNFFEFADNLDKFSVQKFMDDLASALDSDKEILKLQISQWDKGEDSEGKILGYYSKATEILSGGRKKQGDKFNLFDTGSFRDKTYLLGMEKSKDLIFDFDSSDSKTSELLAKISPNIFGLQQKNKDEFTTKAVDKAIEILNINLKIK